METGTLDNACEICGKPLKVDQHDMYLEDVGEFATDDAGDDAYVIAHVQCGIDANLEMA